MIDTLHISTVDYNWPKTGPVLLDQHNLKSIIDQVDPVDVRTSVEDLSCENIIVACNNAHRIVLTDINDTIELDSKNFFLYGRLFYSLIKNSDKIENFKSAGFRWQQAINFLVSSRPTTAPVLWTAGCSITKGFGVEPDQRWGTLLSNYTGLPEVSLSRNGSSIFWAADQLLRSDIRPGDTVVWGLTSLSRLQIAQDWNFESFSVATYPELEKEKQYWNLDYFGSETELLTASRIILQVINFCQHVQAQLYIVNLLDKEWLSVLFGHLDNYIDLTPDLSTINNTMEFIDLGTDGVHPGPQQHQHYATKMYHLIKENNHGKTI